MALRSMRATASTQPSTSAAEPDDLQVSAGSRVGRRVPTSADDAWLGISADVGTLSKASTCSPSEPALEPDDVQVSAGSRVGRRAPTSVEMPNQASLARATDNISAGARGGRLASGVRRGLPRPGPREVPEKIVGPRRTHRSITTITKIIVNPAAPGWHFFHAGTSRVRLNGGAASDRLSICRSTRLARESSLESGHDFIQCACRSASGRFVDRSKEEVVAMEFTHLPKDFLPG